ncbi:transcriptional regulator, IclR family [Virgibacillus subterraneus]|uniref:Transcriptional regulator, IclR family n=2 Tax=Virgibacillus subterraneus TaxID=621109 RepID=A0A1H9G6I4_9BACI|nr:transcriptional regulator, IclR family [Virgibacillus subterraneus]
MNNETDKKRYTIHSIEKALDVLEILSRHEFMSLNEIAEQLSQPKSSLYRILLTLELRGFISHNSDKGYGLGFMQLSLTRNLLEENSLRSASLPDMKKLADKYGDTVNLGVLSHGEVIYLEIIEGTYPLRMTDSVGTKCPIHATAIGKAIAAHIPEDEVRTILQENESIQFTNNTITHTKDYMAELEQVRAKGYALDDEEQVEGARCISAPIFDMLGKVIGAISISGTVHRFSKANIPSIARDVMKTTRNISLKRGFQHNQT